MSRLFLASTALVFIAFGLWGFAAPEDMVARFGLQLAGADARTWVRALYGGNLAGVGVLFAWCAARASRVQFGLGAILLCTGPIFAARVVALVLERSLSPYHLSYAGLEFLGLAGAAMLLRREQSRQLRRQPTHEAVTGVG